MDSLPVEVVADDRELVGLVGSSGRWMELNGRRRRQPELHHISLCTSKCTDDDAVNSERTLWYISWPSTKSS